MQNIIYPFAVALCIAAVIVDVASAKKYSEFIISRQQSQPLWGVVSYGGDAAPSTNEENDIAKNKMENSITSNTTPIISKTSSQILNSVSAGGAFVGGSSKSHVDHQSQTTTTTTSTLQRPSSTQRTTSTRDGSTSPTSLSGLSVSGATQQTNADTVENQDSTSTNTEEQDTQQQRPLKILFLSSDTGGGHRASAEALANQFQRLFPGTTYDLFDIWSDVESSWPYHTIKDTYKSFSSTPWKWRTLYYVSNNAIYAKFADFHSYYMNEDLIREKMEEYNPDVVVSVHPTMNYVPLFSIRKISEKIKRDIPFFTVVTDFGSGHCTWFNKDVDRMYLASEPIKAIAQARGNVPDEKIVMSGLPIRYDFARQADAMGDRTTEAGKAHQMKIREELNIPTNKRMVLVMGGGEGVGSLSDIVNELYAKFRTQGVDATIVVVCGRNEKLKSDLETRCWDTVISQSLQSYDSLKSRFYTKVLSLHAHRSRRIQFALDRAAERFAKGKDVANVHGKVDVIPL